VTEANASLRKGGIGDPLHRPNLSYLARQATARFKTIVEKSLRSNGQAKRREQGAKGRENPQSPRGSQGEGIVVEERALSLIEHILFPDKDRTKNTNEHRLYPYRVVYRFRPVHRKALTGEGVPGRWPAQQLEGKSRVKRGQSGASDLAVRRSAAPLAALPTPCGFCGRPPDRSSASQTRSQDPEKSEERKETRKKIT
jgi:hypothetical protein